MAFRFVPSRAPSRVPRRHAFSSLAAASLLALIGPVQADDVAQVQSVQIFGHGVNDAASVTGFSQPLWRTPIQATVFDTKVLDDIGAVSLSDLTRLDAGISDSYNAIGYWTTFSVRGFTVDNRHNFRRDGLPINAETVLSLDNKSSIEVLKGLSGIQAGLSAPGGLVNLVVKRPDSDLRDAKLRWSQAGTVGAAVDLSQRFGADRAFGARLNVAADRLDPDVRDAVGHRQNASLATDWRIDRDHLIEVEFEHNVQSQPSVPAFSMLGDRVPSPHAVDPRTNLNDQPWSLPVVTQGNTMSLRYTQALDAHWHLKLQALQQGLVSNDHLAFPYGVYSGANNCNPCDRYSSDGQYSIWDFRSDGERRRTRDLEASLSGEFDTGTLRHSLTAGVLQTSLTARFNDEAYNLVGTGTVDGSTLVPANPSRETPNTDRNERSVELYLRDSIQITPTWTAWGGIRQTRLHRQSWETSQGEADATSDYRQNVATPWLAVSHLISPSDMLYASWGEGVESDIVPVHGGFDHPGQPLSATISRQWETGYKHASGPASWGLTAYDTRQAYDGALADLTTFAHDGITHSQGLEANVQARVGAWGLLASAMAQRVRREESKAASNNGLRPANIPDHAVKLGVNYAVAAIPGLSALVAMDYEGDREVLPDNSASIPGWTRFDLGARYTQHLPSTTLIWRGGVDNVFDRRAWREAPYQYGHAYLFPLQPRTLRASIEASF